ncbi:hypothetical protein [Mycoavidus cysteinexigens]
MACAPANPALKSGRSQGEPTVPTTLAHKKPVNPFLQFSPIEL